MTYRERLQQEHPECVDDDYRGGCAHCPEFYGYELTEKCLKYHTNIRNCTECWDREIPEPQNNLLKIDTIVEGIPEHVPDKIPREMVHEMLDMVLDIQAAGDFACFTYSGHEIPVVSVGYAKGEFGDSGFDYCADFCEYTIDKYPSIAEKLKELKNAPDVGASKGR